MYACKRAAPSQGGHPCQGAADHQTSIGNARNKIERSSFTAAAASLRGVLFNVKNAQRGRWGYQ